MELLMHNVVIDMKNLTFECQTHDIIGETFPNHNNNEIEISHEHTSHHFNVNSIHRNSGTFTDCMNSLTAH